MSDKEKMIAILKHVATSKEGYLSYKENGKDDMEVLIFTRKNLSDASVTMIEVQLPWHEKVVGCYRNDDDLNIMCIGIGFSCNKTNTRAYRWFFHRNLDLMCAQCGIKVD